MRFVIAILLAYFNFARSASISVARDLVWVGAVSVSAATTKQIISGSCLEIESSVLIQTLIN